MSSLLKSIFTTPEQVNNFIEFSNLVFILFIIYVGIKTWAKYEEISTLVSYFDDIYLGFNNDFGRDLENKSNGVDIKFVKKYWEDGIKSDLTKSNKIEDRSINFQTILNKHFANVALELKKANSYFEGLASLGLFGTVFGLLIGALYTSGDVKDLSIMISSFSTALITTFLGLFCQLIIRFTRVDVIAENEVEEFQGKILQLAELAKEKPDILSNEFLNKFTAKKENNSEIKLNNKEA